jgi:hypothetical protein
MMIYESDSFASFAGSDQITILSRRLAALASGYYSDCLLRRLGARCVPRIKFEVHETPKDFDSAADLAKRDKYQFQWWACSLVNA